VADQALAAQRQLALTLTGVAGRQVDVAVDTVVETIDSAVEASDATAVNVEDDASGATSPKQDRRPDGRTYEERSVEELRERAGELQIEGRSSMSKDELIAALRNHRQRRPAKNDAPKQERTPDRRSYEDRSIEDLRERARELEIEGRSTMSKDELIAALRQHAK
jgi:hypothetical protein